jgi:hypothetical protein
MIKVTIENPKQKALFARSDIKDLFTFQEDDATASPRSGQSEHGPADAGLPRAGMVRLFHSQREEGQDLDRIETGVDIQDATPFGRDALANDANANEQSSSDKKLLLALFEGDNISSVYDHHYLDPTTTTKENSKFAQRAQEVVQQKLRTLQESTAVYIGPAGKHGGENMDSSSSSSSSSSVPVFGAARATRDPSNSSASFLATVRASSHLSDMAASSDQKVQKEPLHAPTSSTTAVSSSKSRAIMIDSLQVPDEDEAAISSQAHASSRKKRTVREDIRFRLEAIFDEYDAFNRSSSSSSKRSSGDDNSLKYKVSSGYILSRFTDLGDQYAPLFKEILKSIATLKDGHWVRRH